MACAMVDIRGNSGCDLAIACETNLWLFLSSHDGNSARFAVRPLDVVDAATAFPVAI